MLAERVNFRASCPMPPISPKRGAPAPRPRRRWTALMASARTETRRRRASVGEVLQAATKDLATVILDESARVEKDSYSTFTLLLLRSAYLGQALNGRTNPQLEKVEAGSGHLNIDRRDIQIFQLLGSGRTATVYEGSWNGRPVAVKTMEAGEQSSDLIIVRELGILSCVEHPNLVTLMGACREGSTFQMVLELCKGGSLFELLHNSDYWATLRQQLKIAEDVARAMAYLHGMSPPIMHRDLKSLNVLLRSVVSDERHVPIAKVTDFGMAKACFASRQGRRNSRHVGTIQWMSPELLVGGTDYATEVDVYAYGVLLFEIMSCEPPFCDIPMSEVKPVVLHGGRPELDDSIPGSVAELIEECWAHDPKSRPAFFEVVEDLVALRKSTRKLASPGLFEQGGIN